MTKTHSIIFALCLVSAPPPATAQSDQADRALLSTFCDAANIQGAACKRAKFYPDAGRRRCAVKLTPDRYSGNFLGSGNSLLVVRYESECEAHVNDFGGVALFEQTGGTYGFRGFRPGMQGSDCLTLGRSEREDLLVCITGHMGQGDLETRLAQVIFKEEPGKRSITMSFDFMVEAEDMVDAYGANVVECTGGATYFGLSKLKAGPQPNMVTVEVSYADADTIRTACGKGFPKPEETYGELGPGQAYVPEGYEKQGRMIVDVLSRKITLE